MLAAGAYVAPGTPQRGTTMMAEIMPAVIALAISLVFLRTLFTLSHHWK
jgi:hypothetical protein